MRPEMEKKIQKVIFKLAELNVECAQPRNPYCTTGILLGTAEEPLITLNFWKGEPSVIEFRQSTFPVSGLKGVAEAVKKAGRVAAEFERAGEEQSRTSSAD